MFGSGHRAGHVCKRFESVAHSGSAEGSRSDGVWKAKSMGNRVDGSAGCDRADREYARR